MRNAKLRMQNAECRMRNLSLASLTRISHSHLSLASLTRTSHTLPSHSPLSLLKRRCLLVTVALEVIVAGRRSEFG